MELTSSKCRAQEAVQRDRAANAQLENVRVVAERAANAWAKEAIEAERREARRARARTIEQMAALQKQRREGEDSDGDADCLGNGPDRGPPPAPPSSAQGGL